MPTATNSCSSTCPHRPICALQGFAAFKLNVQLSQEYNDNLAKAVGKFRNQLVASAFETWKQHAQHNKLLKSRLATAVGALRNRDLRSAFCGWREAAALRKEHKQKVCCCCTCTSECHRLCNSSCRLPQKDMSLSLMTSNVYCACHPVGCMFAPRFMA